MKKKRKELIMGGFSRDGVLKTRQKMRAEALGGWLLSTVIICLFVAGCKRRGQPTEPELAQVVTNRMQDAAYVQALHANRDLQMANAYAREQVTARQRACVERIRATLPENADDETLQAALQKDPEWAELEAESQKVAAAALQAQEDAKFLIRARLQEEEQAIKDVQSGKAKVAEPGRAE